jgi:hypothetical protein
MLTMIWTTCVSAMKERASAKVHLRTQRQYRGTYTVGHGILCVVVREVDGKESNDAGRVQQSRLDCDTDRTSQTVATAATARTTAEQDPGVSLDFLYLVDNQDWWCKRRYSYEQGQLCSSSTDPDKTEGQRTHMWR